MSHGKNALRSIKQTSRCKTYHVTMDKSYSKSLMLKLFVSAVWLMFPISVKVLPDIWAFLRGWWVYSVWWLIPISHMTTSCAQWVYCTQFFGRLNGVSEMIAGSQQTIVNYVDWKSHSSPVLEWKTPLTHLAPVFDHSLLWWNLQLRW